MKKQYILFDFDGVIVNTEPQNAHFLSTGSNNAIFFHGC